VKTSTERFLVTHVGSLPRPADLLELLSAKERGEPVNDGQFRRTARKAVRDCVARQVELGFDVVTDGEMSKPSFLTYINDRLGGFERQERETRSPFAGSREFAAFPEYYEWVASTTPNAPARAPHMVCTGPVTYTGRESLQGDIDNLRAALEGFDVTEAFLPSISPSNVEEWQLNEYYDSDEAYLYAIADALREEYQAIVDSGFLVQIDDPRLLTYYMVEADTTIEDYRRWAATRVDALNHALRGIDPGSVRFHTCYSVNIGPRVSDVELKTVVDIMLDVNAGAYSFEAANPRHEHEWRVWEEVDLPEDKVLLPGLITQSSVVVEHPDTVAERLLRFAGAVRRENVIASADCGFATFAAAREIHESIVWAKLDALAEGARRATAQMWP
jgi:5-methyltetrahydropteroyltriglutamate--homocysteine methyltransferase